MVHSRIVSLPKFWPILELGIRISGGTEVKFQTAAIYTVLVFIKDIERNIRFVAELFWPSLHFGLMTNVFTMASEGMGLGSEIVDRSKYLLYSTNKSLRERVTSSVNQHLVSARRHFNVLGKHGSFALEFI